MKATRKKPTELKKSARLKALQKQLREGVYRVDPKRLTEALFRAARLSLN